MLDFLEHAFRLFVVCQAAFVVGMSLVILKVYARDPRMRHIGAVAASYILLLLLNAGALFEQTWHASPQRLAVSALAYALGDYALLWLLHRTRHRPSRPQDVVSVVIDMEERVTAIENEMLERGQ